jgi:hypothetical protein
MVFMSFLIFKIYFYASRSFWSFHYCSFVIVYFMKGNLVFWHRLNIIYINGKMCMYMWHKPLMRGRCLYTTNRAWEDLMTKNTLSLCHWKHHHIFLVLVWHMLLITSDLSPVRFFFFFFSNPKGTLGSFYWWYFNFSFFFYFVFVFDLFVEVLFAFNFIIQSQFCNMLFFPISSWLFYLVFFGHFVKLIFLFNLTLQSNFFFIFFISILILILLIFLGLLLNWFFFSILPFNKK